MADELKARLSVDTSDFNSKIAQAMAQAKLATEGSAAAFKKYGSDAAAGSQEAIDAIAKNIAAVDGAKAAVAALRAEQDKLNTSVSHTVSTMAAASGEIRLFEGNIPIRAVENFAAKTLGLGPIMQAAFPIAGALAMGAIFIQVGEKMKEAFDIGGERARAVQQDIDNVTLTLNRSSTALDVQIDKLQQEQAKLEHKPFNGMKLVLDEAAEAAQNLAVKLEAVIEREGKAIGGMSASLPEKLLTGKTGTDHEQTMLKEHSKWLRESNSTQQQLNESISFGNTLQDRLSGILAKQREEQEAAAAAVANSHGENAGGAVTDYGNQIRAVQELMRYQKQEQGNIQKTIELSKEQAVVQKLKDEKTPKGGADKDGAKQFRSAEEARDKEKETGATDESKRGLLSANADKDFWEAQVSQFQKYPAQLAEIQKKLTQDSIEIEKQATSFKRSEMDKAVSVQKLAPPEDVMRGADKMAEWREKTNDNLTQAGDAWNKYREDQKKAGDIAAQVAQAQTLVRIELQLQAGAISKTSADYQIAGAQALEYAAKLQVLRDQLAALEAQQRLDPVTGNNTDSKNAGQQQQVKNQIAQLQQQQVAAAGKDTKTLTTDIAKPYLDAWTQVESGFMRVQQQMLAGHKTFSQAMRAQEQQWAMTAIENIEKVLFKKLVTDNIMVASQAAAQSKQTTIAAAGAAQTSAIDKTTAVQSLSASAASAAGKAYSAMAGIPIVGPELGAIAAAATYAGVITLAAFETGTAYVPRTGVAVIHEGEQVVNRRNNDELMSLARSGAGKQQGGGHTFNNTMNYHSHGGGNKTDARHASKMMQKQVLRAHAVMS